MCIRDSLISLKKDTDATKQWKVVDIEGSGVVILAAILPNGEVTQEAGGMNKVIGQDFLEKYKQVQKQLKPLSNYPKNDAVNSVDNAELIAKGAVAFALVALMNEFPLDDSLRAVTEPMKAVYAKAAFSKGGLTIVPCTTSISCDAKR